MDSDFFGTSTDTPGGPNHEKPAKASGSQQKTRPKPRNSYPQGAATTHPASQDLIIAVRKRKDVDGFGPWTMKAGIVRVQPPVEVMQGILAIRLHLDESELDNGPLRVIAGSHLEGRLSAERILSRSKGNCVTCTVPKGGALLMRPLLLHGSSACAIPKSRRVIHLEFAAAGRPEGLDWHLGRSVAESLL